MAKQNINWTPIIVALIIVLGLGAVAGYYFMNQSSTQHTVSANGAGQIFVSPDRAVVYVSVQARNASADGAKNMNAAMSEKVMNALLALGIAKTDIETQNYYLQPEYSYDSGKQTLIDYIASNDLKVSTKNFDNAGKIVDAAGNAGALISSINFDLSIEKQNQYKAQVLGDASKDAKTKAEAIAAGLGKSLGSLVSVASSDYNYRPYPLYMAAASGVSAKEAATNISPQQLEVDGSVTVTYSIK